MKNLTATLSAAAMIVIAPLFAQNSLNETNGTQSLVPENQEISNYSSLNNHEEMENTLQPSFEQNGTTEQNIRLHTLEVVLDKEMAIEVWPNPSNGLFKLKLPQNAGIESIEIYDFTGRLVYVERGNVLYDSILREMDMVEEKRGTYIVIVRTADKTYSDKIIIN